VKYQVRDWAAHNSRVITTAGHSRGESVQVREAATQLARDTTTELQRTQREVQNRLTLRIDDIATREADLDKCIADTFKEIGNLQNHLDLVRSTNQSKDLPLDITRECMTWRQDRAGIDLVVDDVERQLGEEEVLIEQIKSTLGRRAEDCAEQLRLLRAAHHQLETDKTDKFTAFQIDKSCASLEITSREIDHHFGSTIANPKSVEPQDWDGYTGDNIYKARQQILSSEQLREAVDAYLVQSQDSQTTQLNKTDDAFNARLEATADAKRVDEQNLAKTQTELDEQSRAIVELQRVIDSRDAPLKVAETRLTRRTQRPNVELVHDPVEDILVTEVQDTEAALEAFRQQLGEAEAAHRALIRAEMMLVEDIGVKTQSLTVDNRCMQRRQQFKYRAGQ